MNLKTISYFLVLIQLGFELLELVKSDKLRNGHFNFDDKFEFKS